MRSSKTFSLRYCTKFEVNFPFIELDDVQIILKPYLHEFQESMFLVFKRIKSFSSSAETFSE